MTEWHKPEMRPLHAEGGQLVAGAVLFRPQGDDSAVFWCAHCGSSMNPTLNQFDLLEVVPYRGRPPRRGDVVVFLPPEGERPVVHRVVRAAPGGIRTRGDNASPDPWLLQADDLAGRVVAAWRGGRRRRIWGGRIGRLQVRARRIVGIVDRTISRLLHRPYRLLARGGWMRRLLPRSLRPRVVLFQVEGRTLPRLLVGRRVVGWYDPRAGRWQVRRPFRLFVNERMLNVDGQGPSPMG